MSVCLSIHPGPPHGILSTHWTSCHESLYLSIFQNYWENYSFTKIREEKQVLHLKTSIHLWLYFAHFFLEWEMFQTSIVEKIKSHTLCSITFVRTLYHLWNNVKKINKKIELYRPLMTTWCMHMWWITKATNTHPIEIWNTYCISNAILVAPLHLSFVLYMRIACLVPYFTSSSI
jgi:hypothetical protein